MTKKPTAAIAGMLLLVAGLIGLSIPTAAAVPASTPPRPAVTTNAVYFSPHQDDESIGMGALVAQDVKAHKHVEVVLVGDGTSSRAAGLICEVKKICLSPYGQKLARDAEFIAALAAQGVPRSQIHLLNIPESAFAQNTAAITASIAYWTKLYGATATYTTMSWLDRHPDHKTLALALDSTCRARGLKTGRFAISYLYRADTATIPSNIAPTAGLKLHSYVDTSSRMIAALQQYKVWNTAAGRYAIGGDYSVMVLVDTGLRKHDVVYHDDSQSYASPATRAAGLGWSGRPTAFDMRLPTPVLVFRDGRITMAQVVVDNVNTGIVTTVAVDKDWSRFYLANSRLTRLSLPGTRWLDASSDLDGDHRPDVLRVTNQGALVLLSSRTNWSVATQLGQSMAGYDLFAVVPQPTGGFELFARSATDRNLYGFRFFRPTGHGLRSLVASHWGAVLSLAGAGDLDGDGRDDLISTDPSGAWQVLVTPRGSLVNPTPITLRGLAAKGMRIEASGEFDGYNASGDTRNRDLIVSSGGVSYLFRNTSQAMWGPAQRMGIAPGRAIG